MQNISLSSNNLSTLSLNLEGKSDNLESIFRTNPLVRFATPVLMMMIHVPDVLTSKDVISFRNKSVESINEFEQNLMNIKCPKHTVNLAVFLVCAALDEAILSKQWGLNSVCSQIPLLYLLCKETKGGEKFYNMIKSMMRDPRKHKHLLELAYCILSLGYEGEYFGDKQGASRDTFRNSIFYEVRNICNKPDRSLASSTCTYIEDTKMVTGNQKFKRIFSIGASIFISSLIFFNVMSIHQLQPLSRELANIGTASPVAVYSQLLSRNIVSHQ